MTDKTTDTTTDTHETPHTAVTVVGLGVMGHALAEAFLRAGHPVTVWNRTPDKADRLVEGGARRAGSVAEAVAASPLVVVCVSDYHAAHDLFDPLDAEILAGRVLVNLTSGTSRDARETAHWAAGRGAAYLDGAIMAAPAAIGGADTAVLYSGPASTYELHEAALRTLAGGSTYVGEDHGLASLYDAAMLSLMWNLLNGFLQGVALLGTAGVGAAAYEPVASQGIGTVVGWLAGYARNLDAGVHPGDDATLSTHLGAMAHLVEESETLGLNAELPRLIQTLAQRAVRDGRGADGYTALIDQFRKPSPEALA
ncbi:NAD(P)-dependent oxidoreductase [Yinghuangia seranimata]|uniref:NAD(P)-dependent oxidoreductase n=1 Tax=Yinghuangia seranimata TaxID=408067 RepID=UPI00248D0E9A|nr:NAD(P)-binding domain-containing protein [Yinghuangia seranimata]MDI2130679.1 NAD(P)-binding domain-containing protein [Yinghuangia seranimata]